MTSQAGTSRPSVLPDTPLARNSLRSWFRTQDFAWILFVTVLLVTSETNYDATILLILIAAFQIVEPRLAPFSTRAGQMVSLTMKLVLCYLLIGWTHTIFSPYYPIFLLPVISAATTLELSGVLIVTALACLSYFSFLLPIYIDWSFFELPPHYLDLMGVRAAFFAIVAVLVFEQAKAKRTEMARTERTVRQLAETNANLRKAEVSLRRSERLAALGQLTAGLAHELRNPLGTIRGSAEMLSKQAGLARPEVTAELAGYIQTEADRMNALVGHFLDFAKPLRIQPVKADLLSVVNDVLREQSALAETRGVALRTTGETVLQFAFDPGLMRLALSNLVQNAIQASESGTAIVVACGREEGTVHIYVKDQGAGIEPQHLENIFNPFFTTKPQGTGLGLAIVAKIVDEHGGRIRASSVRGEGTSFEITLSSELSV